MRSLRNLALFVAAGNALVLWLAYYWLGLGEARTVTLLWSLVVALFVGVFALWLHGATFAHFHQTKLPRVRVAFRTALRNLPALALAAVVVGALYFALAAWNQFSPRPAFRIASYLTLKFRKPVKPSVVLQFFHVALWLVRWVVLPAILLPALSAIAASGLRGSGKLADSVRRGRHWIVTPLLLLLALWVPFKIIGWTPRPGSFALQVVSFAARFGIAYLLFVTAWISLAFFSAGGSPRFSQEKTSTSP
jgi:hypothetical protein